MNKLDFIGFYNVIMDKKNRVMIPAEYKRVMKTKGIEELVIIHSQVRVGANKVPLIMCYASKEYEKIMANPEKLGKKTQIFYRGFRKNMDSMGRISIPYPIINVGGLSNDLTIAGKGDHFDVWNSKDYKNYISCIATASKD